MIYSISIGTEWLTTLTDYLTNENHSVFLNHFRMIFIKMNKNNFHRHLEKNCDLNCVIFKIWKEPKEGGNV